MEDSAFKLCPFCKEQIRREAIKCRFCGEWLESSEPDSARKLATDKPVVAPPTSPQEGTEANSMKAVGRALDETYHQQRTAHPAIPDIQNKPPKQASAKTGTSRKSVWRLVGGMFLLAGVFNNLSHNLPHNLRRHDLTYVITFVVLNLLLAATGVWLVSSYLRTGRKLSKRSRRTLLILSVGLLLFVLGAAYYLQKSAESNKQSGNALRAFGNDVHRYVEAGGIGNFPTIKPTGDATTDLIGRCMNDLFQEAGSFFGGMNRELNALEEKGVFETSVLSDKRSLETQSRKRIEGQRIIETYRNDLPRAFDTWRQKLASYNLPNEQKKNAMDAWEDIRPKLSHQYETLFNLLGKKEKTEFDFLSFMAGAFNEYKLNDGKISFNNLTARQRYSELAKDIEDTAKETTAFRKESVGNVNDIQKLSR